MWTCATPSHLSLWYRNPARADVCCHLVVPPSVSAASRMVVVLHGTERNPVSYRASWTDWARRHDRIVICPLFDRDGWRGSAGYLLGGVLDTDRRPQPERAWAYTALTEIAARVRAAFGLVEHRFDLWGHSAGAQFVHRYLLFAPDAPVRSAIAANAGWYTLPALNTRFPYGLDHPDLGLTRDRALAWTARPLLLMRGDRDVERDAALRVTTRADRQGRNRFERAATMHRAGHLLDPGCRWRLVDVRGTAHQFDQMAGAAQRLLSDPIEGEHESVLTDCSSTAHRNR